MCGLVAWLDRAGHSGREATLRRAVRRMNHRGPDGTGAHIRGPIALGHCRLSIIDAEGGAQPMLREAGQLALVYNGEIYNHAEIAAELRGRGAALRTRSDTEVILAAYETWGTACLERFIGMFAFALWDERKSALWVVRDRLGIKPLYYWTEGSQFACASEIGPLLELGVVRASLNRRVLDAYFTLGYVPAPETLFSGIRKLEPGHHMLVGPAGVETKEYWDFAAIEPEPWDEAETRSRLEPLLQDAVRRCLVSDAPLGAFLSGGLDSSAAVALMARCGVDPVNTFTAGFSRGGETSEEPYARMVAAKFHCRHFVHDLPPGDFLASIDELVRRMEEPVVEPSGIALHALAAMARPEVKVLLSGEGSDEVFGGYGIYRRMLSMERWSRMMPPLSGRIPVWLSRRLGDAATKYCDWIRQPLTDRFRGTSALLTGGLRHKLYEPGFGESAGDYLEGTFRRHFDRTEHHREPLSRLLYVDTRTWLADDLLVKADKMTMAASVELRVPFLDHRLVELSARIPADQKIRGNEGKWILKRAMESQLPREVVWRKKMGFPVPVGQWFNESLRPALRERLLENNRLPWLRPESVRDLVENPAAPTEGRSRMLMTLLVLEAWQRIFIVGQG